MTAKLRPTNFVKREELDEFANTVFDAETDLQNQVKVLELAIVGLSGMVELMSDVLVDAGLLTDEATEEDEEHDTDRGLSEAEELSLSEEMHHRASDDGMPEGMSEEERLERREKRAQERREARDEAAPVTEPSDPMQSLMENLNSTS